MGAGMTWTQPRSLTFSERMKWTSVLFLTLWVPWGGWLAVLWSSGVTVSSSVIVPERHGKLLFVSGNGQKAMSVEIMMPQRNVTVTVA